MPKRAVADELEADAEICEWNTDPMTMMHWFKKLPDHLEAVVPDAQLWWSQGATMTRAVLRMRAMCGVCFLGKAQKTGCL